MKTKVCFRVFPEGDVIALFMDEICDPDGNILSYQRVGQHGAASTDLEFELEPATASEYRSLLAELMAVGYTDLEVVP